MTDNDRELLELAAKAYGIQVKGWFGNKLRGFDTNTGWAVSGDWNPLQSDADALRLMVALSIQLEYAYSMDGIAIATVPFTEIKAVEIFNKSSGNKQAATRRAIVLAAAEIGRGMG